MKVRYNGDSDAFTMNGQTVGRGGVLTLNRDRDLPILRALAGRGTHRFSIVDDLPDDEQEAVLEAAKAVEVPIEAVPVEVFETEPEIPSEAPEAAAETPKKRGK